MNAPGSVPQQRRWQWGVPADKQIFHNVTESPPFLNEVLLDFPDPNTVPRAPDFEPTAKTENIVKYLRSRHHEQRHRLLNRHEAEYKKWKAETELCVDDAAFQFDHSLSKAQPGMCEQSFELISSETAKAALTRLPASKRNVLISVEQLKQPSSGIRSPADEARRNQATTAEFAAKIGRMGTDLRRQMLNEEEEMRMHQFETLELFYEALQRTDPSKYPNKEELAKRAAQSGNSAPQQQLVGVSPGQSASGSYKPASTGLGRPATSATATAGVGIGGLPAGPMRPTAPTRDPRLAPPRDPRLDRR